jgi:hypothetical protein
MSDQSPQNCLQMTCVSFNGDPRPYLGSKPSTQSRFYVYCQATEERDGVILKCAFSQRKDDFRRNLLRSVLHKCTFAPSEPARPRQLMIDAFRARERSNEITPIVRDVAVLMATANLSARSVCGGNLRALLIATYLSGWREASIRDPKKVKRSRQGKRQTEQFRALRRG